MANEHAPELAEEALLGDVPELDDSSWDSLLNGAFSAPEGAADDLVDSYDPDADAEQYDPELADDGANDAIDTSLIDDAAAMNETDSSTAAAAHGDDTDAAEPQPAASDDDYEGINDPFAIIDLLEEPVTDVDGTDSASNAHEHDALDDVEDPTADSGDDELPGAQDEALDPLENDGRFDGIDTAGEAEHIDDGSFDDQSDFGNI